jgi:hypothetical protein
MAGGTNQRGNAAGSCSYVEEDAGGGLIEKDSKPSPVTSSALTGSDPGQEVVQEEATPESGRTAAGTNQRGNAADSCSSLEKDGSSVVEGGGRDEEESKPSLVTSSELIGSDPGQCVVQEEATPDQIPSDWTVQSLSQTASLGSSYVSSS